ncbi:hypothetical protein [Pseudomonas fulva]|uniref:hypothetical protein n=1 Tax=Pseudomonas fulva TaxID=47880 RepID=UPI002DBEAE7C|nr:hypothetical protein [Pseudomonas fulva]MEB8059312.1 hypothetical protein [Pseudomonas fulva]
MQATDQTPQLTDKDDKPRNAPLTVELDGYFVDALEEFLLQTAHSSRVAAGLANEDYPGQARAMVDIHGETLARRLAWKVRDLVPAGALANAIEVADAASAEYRNSEAYEAYKRAQELRNDQEP